VIVALFQMPWRSGSPHGVRGGVHVFAAPAAFGFCFSGAFWAKAARAARAAVIRRTLVRLVDMVLIIAPPP
jgi:hypothetical protein